MGPHQLRDCCCAWCSVLAGDELRWLSCCCGQRSIKRWQRATCSVSWQMSWPHVGREQVKEATGTRTQTNELA